MKRQIRNEHWNLRIMRAKDRLEEADAKLTEAIYIDLRPWYRRIDWPLIGLAIATLVCGLALAYVLILACEDVARFLEVK